MSLKELMAGAVALRPSTPFLAEVRIYEGKVMDNSGNPLEFANVALQSLEDSTLIDGSVTDAEGKFAVREALSRYSCESQQWDLRTGL